MDGVEMLSGTIQISDIRIDGYLDIKKTLVKALQNFISEVSIDG